MGVFTNLFQDEIKFIEEKYKIKILEIKNIDNGILNSNFYIETKNKKYILRIYEANRTVDEEKQELILFKDKIKNNLSENNLAYIKENTKDSYRNKYILEKLQNIDFTKLNIFVSEPSYTNEYPSSLLALNMNEDTYYFELFFIFDNQNKKWLIFDLKERGWAYEKFWKRNK